MKKNIIIWIIFAAVILFALGLYIVNRNQNLMPTVSPSIIPLFDNAMANWQTATLNLGVLGVSGSVQYKYPSDWQLEQNMNQQYLRPKTNRLPEEIFTHITPVLGGDSYQFIPPTAAGLPDPNPPVKKFGDNAFYYDQGQFEGQWDQAYEILSPDKSKGARFTLIVRGGRQQMDYYLPQSEIQPEINILGKILSTFKFIE